MWAHRNVVVLRSAFFERICTNQPSSYDQQLSEDELSPHLSSFREAVTRISELEEKAIEELKEVRQVCLDGPNWLIGLVLPNWLIHWSLWNCPINKNIAAYGSGMMRSIYGRSSSKILM